MDQDSFRQLLQTRGGTSATAAKTTTTTWGTSSSGKKAKTKNAKAEAAQPGFKPRAVKKASTYRDRAAERREGDAGDYAQVEALAEDFERRNADQDPKTVEEQRRYLGGDSTHTVLVKGLDFALLEQNKARAVSLSVEDDDTLEQAFIEGSSTLPKKRTREEIVAELRNKRAKGDAGALEAEETKPSASDTPLAEAKKAGKFKPIGFKPIGGVEKGKKVVKKIKGEKGEGKKKKAKTSTADSQQATKDSTITAAEAPVVVNEKVSAAAKAANDPEPEPIDPDFDIFAGAGDYTGLELGDDDDDNESDVEPGAIVETDAVPESVPRRKWFDTEDSPEPEKAKSKSPPPEQAQPPTRVPAETEEGEEPEEEAPVRLAPLASSAVPSIQDILAADKEAERQEKRRARKEKKKGNLDAAGKVDRDYQRLKAYTDKKGGGP